MSKIHICVGYLTQDGLFYFHPLRQQFLNVTKYLNCIKFFFYFLKDIYAWYFQAESHYIAQAELL